MRGRKPKKNQTPTAAAAANPAVYAWLWLFIMRLLAIVAGKPEEVRRLSDPPPAAKKEKPPKQNSSPADASTHATVKAQTKTANSKSSRRTPSPAARKVKDKQITAPPVLKFSAGFDNKPTKMKEEEQQQVVNNEPVMPVKSAPVAGEKSTMFAKKFTQPKWRKLKILTSNTRKDLVDDFDISGSSHAEKLIYDMSFLYRYHLLHLALKGVIREGSDKYDLYNMRTMIVHNVDNHLFDDDLYAATKAALKDLNLEELNQLSGGKRTINGFEIADALKEMPLYRFLKDQEQLDMFAFTENEKQTWMMKLAIPLLNTMHTMMQDASQNNDMILARHAKDAIKMMIIIIGEYCPKTGETIGKGGDKKDEADFALKNSGSFDDFRRDCRLLRNCYAHKAITEHRDDQLHDFLAAASKVNNNSFDIMDEHISQVLSPQRAKMQREASAKSVAARRK